MTKILPPELIAIYRSQAAAGARMPASIAVAVLDSHREMRDLALDLTNDATTIVAAAAAAGGEIETLMSALHGTAAALEGIMRQWSIDARSVASVEALERAYGVGWLVDLWKTWKTLTGLEAAAVAEAEETAAEPSAADTTAPAADSCACPACHCRRAATERGELPPVVKRALEDLGFDLSKVRIVKLDLPRR